jgi:serine/threonine protein kinase
MPKIGQGTFGCVYRPSLECKEPKPAAFYKNKVSKATDYENAKNEINEQAKIDKIDKSYTYHLPPPVLCSLKKEIIKDCKIQSKPDTLLILEDGGLNLSDFIKKVINSSNFTIKEKKKMIYDFWVDSYALIQFLSDLSKNNTFHNDLKPHNVLFNPLTNKLNIIDFGQMKNHVHKIYFAKWHFSYPPESIFYKVKSKDYDSITKMSDEQFKKLFLNKYLYLPYISSSNNEFIKKYSVFLRYASKENYLLPGSQYKYNYHFNTNQDFLDNFSQNFTRNTNHTQLKKKYKNTMDIYGLGFALIHVLINSYSYLDSDIFIAKIYKLLYLMVHPNCFERIEIDELLPKYKETIELLKNSSHNKSSSTPTSSIKSLIVSKEDLLKYDVSPPKEIKKNKCKSDEEKNPDTNRCRKKCKDGQFRNPATQRCNNVKKNKTVKQVKSAVPKKCKDDEETNPATNRCRKKCKDGQYRNVSTQRCRKTTTKTKTKTINDYFFPK